MKKLIILMFFCGCGFIAAAHTADTLNYRYNEIKKNSKPIYTAEGDTIISSFVLTYPVFDSARWTGTAKNIIFHTEPQNDRSTSLDHFIAKFISSSEEDNSETDFPRMWDRNLSLIVKKQIPGTKMLGFELNDVGYTGGAHGYAQTQFYNFDTTTGMRLRLDDIIYKEQFNKLNLIAESIFRKQENLTPNQSLDNYFFKDNKFRLNSNFLIQKSGLLFYFNQYEIRSYAEGPMELFIHYSAIKSLIKPNPYTPKLIP